MPPIPVLVTKRLVDTVTRIVEVSVMVWMTSVVGRQMEGPMGSVGRLGMLEIVTGGGTMVVVAVIGGGVWVYVWVWV